MADVSVKDQFLADVLGTPIEEKPVTEATTTTTKTEAASITPAAALAPTQPELSDADLIALLGKRGVNIQSFDDLKKPETPEEIAAKAEKRKNDALAWGLSQGKVKKEDYDNLQKLNTNKFNVLYDDYAALAKEQDPTATEEDIQQNFQEYITTNKKFLEELADSRIKNKFSPIFNLENEYSKYEEEENNKSGLKRKVEAAMPVYKADVQNALTSNRKIEFTIEDKENVSNNVPVAFEFTDADLKEVEEDLFDGNQALARIKQGYSQEDLTQQTKLILIAKNLPKIVNTIAKNYNSVQKEKYYMARKNTTLTRELDISMPDLKSNKDDVYAQLIASVTPAAPQPNK